MAKSKSIIVPMTCQACEKIFSPRRPNKKLKYCSVACKGKVLRSFSGFPDCSEDLSAGTKGAVTELLVAAKLMGQGWQVFRSLSPNGPVDLVAIKGDVVRKLQVKTGVVYTKTGVRYPNKKTGIGNYPVGTEIAVYYFDTGDLEFVPLAKK